MGGNWIKQLEKRAAGEVEGFLAHDQPVPEGAATSVGTDLELEVEKLRKELDDLRAERTAPPIEVDPNAQPAQ